MTRTIVAGLDIETTGLSQPDGHRMVEVAAILYDFASRERLGAFETRINPERGIDPKAQAVHGIKFEDLIHAPRWESIAPKLSALLSKCQYVVAHNGEGFDLPFVWGEFLRVGVPMPEVRLVDTMLQGRWATHDGAVPNLGALCFASGVPYDTTKAHGATYDVEVMMDCFFRHWQRGFFRLPVAPYKFVPQPSKEKKA